MNFIKLVLGWLNKIGNIDTGFLVIGSVVFWTDSFYVNATI